MLPTSYSILAAPARLLHLLKLHTLPKDIALFAPLHRTTAMSNAAMFQVPKKITFTLAPEKIASLQESLLRAAEALAPALSPPFHGVPLNTTYPRPAGHIPDLLLSTSSAAKDAGALPHAGEAGLSDYLSRFLMSPASAILRLAYSPATVFWRVAGTGVAGRPDFELVYFDQQNCLETFAAVELKTVTSLSNEQLGNLIEGIGKKRYTFTIEKDFFKAPGGYVPYTYPRIRDPYCSSTDPERSTEELVLEQVCEAGYPITDSSCLLNLPPEGSPL